MTCFQVRRKKKKREILKQHFVFPVIGKYLLRLYLENTFIQMLQDNY